MNTRPWRARNVAAAALALAFTIAAPEAWAQTGGENAPRPRDGTPQGEAGAGGGWTLEMTIYLWATGIDGDVGIRGRTAEIDISFGDLIENVDGALMLAFEARKKRWGIGTDLILFKMSDQAGTPGPLFSGVEVSVQQTFLEVSPRYRILEPDPVALDLILGARLWHLSERLRFTEDALPTLLVEAGDQWIDPIAGLRAIASLSSRWLIQGRADIGGFDVGSHLTWQVLGAVGYRVSDSFEIRAGYRHLDVDFNDEEDGFLYDVGLGGLIVGVTIKL